MGGISGSSPSTPLVHVGVIATNDRSPVLQQPLRQLPPPHMQQLHQSVSGHGSQTFPSEVPLPDTGENGSRPASDAACTWE